MVYEEAMSFLKGTEKYGSRPGLDSIRNLMRELGDAQERVPVVHIAGTNGKGSVGAMLSSVLAESGYQVGRFNTPDVFSYEEEFLMNGVPIEKGRLAQLFTEVSEACGQMTEKGLPHPTRFEVETAAAFLWFYQEQCDVALVEVGLGGEKDATNLIKKPLVSVLTPISMDHMKFLGNTLSEIAAAKAGIIKKGCPVVSAAQKPEVWEVIREKCRRDEAELFLADGKLAGDPEIVQEKISFQWDMAAFSVEEEDVKEHEGRFFDSVHDEKDQFDVGKNEKMHEGRTSRGAENDSGRKLICERITLGLRGSFQLENAVCALRVLELLKKQYPGIYPSSVISGLRNTRWPGRFEQVASSPDVYLDGAHNEDAAAKLRAALDQSFPCRRIIYIMGVLADKEYEKMIRIMFREGDRVYTLTPPNPRALPAEELAAQLKKQKIDAIPCANPRDAVSYALEDAGAGTGGDAGTDADTDADGDAGALSDAGTGVGASDGNGDMILALGSLYYLGDVREILYRRQHET